MTDLPRTQTGKVQTHVIRRIKKPHLVKAFADFDAGVEHEFADSKKFDVIFEGAPYPPKAIVGLAGRYALGVLLVPDDFSGGEDSVCFEVLREAGYEIVAKDLPPPGSTWIFQANPDDFDIDGYLREHVDRVSWLVRQHADAIRVGDFVYFWRAGGRTGANDAGIVAAGRVLTEVTVQGADPASLPFARGDLLDADEPRVWLRVDRVANKKQVIRRDWLKDDPVCHDLSILKQAAGTNFPVGLAHAERLRELWSSTGAGSAAGTGWTDNELRASVEAYKAMQEALASGGRVNKSAIYKGLSGEFPARSAAAFGRRMQNISHVLHLLGRDWIPGLRPLANVGGNIVPRIEAILADVEGGVPTGEAEELANLNLAWKKPQGAKPKGSKKPKRLAGGSSRAEYARDKDVKTWVLKEAAGTCECCEAEAPFKDANGIPFLEVHHVVRLADAGPDTVDNAVAVCPNCHRALHLGLHRAKLVADLYERVTRLSRPAS